MRLPYNEVNFDPKTLETDSIPEQNFLDFQGFHPKHKRSPLR